MLLHCTLVRSPGAALQEPPAELTIEGPRGRSGTELQEQLAARFGTGKVSVDGQSISSLILGQPPLVNGAVLVDGGMADGGFRPRQRTSEPPASLALAVNSGAGAGIVVPLRRGTYIIGRSDGEILIPDSDLSRSHARLVVTETAISLEDLDSANGIEVDGERVRHAIVSTGSIIRCGNSTMSLVFLEQPNSRLDAAGLAVDEPLVVSRGQDPANRATLWLTAVLPLVIGVGLAVVTGMWMFLAFTAVSVISLLVPLVSGRRQRRELAAAVRAAVANDQRRRRRAGPPLSDLTIGVLFGRVVVGGGAAAAGPEENQPAAPPADGVWLRFGQAEQPANLRFDPADPRQPIPSAGVLPLTLNPGRPLTTIRGPQASIDGLVRSLVMQLAGYPSGRGTRLLIHGSVDQLPLAARYLDDVTLSNNATTSGTVLERGSRSRHGVLILLDTAVSADAIIQKAQANGWQILRFSSGAAASTPADVELREGSSLLRVGDRAVRFAPDMVPHGVFNMFCRRLAQNTHGTGNPVRAIPVSCRLKDTLPHSKAETATRWSTNRNRPGLTVPIGLSLDGVQLLDLQSDGPHLLVAGTTGSGKSDLLRSLTVALALSYPPDRINFLFVDFKGGSGLGPLTGLPHCGGILTDLKSHELERALQSLRAEIRFRENALAEVQAPDLVSYRGWAATGPPLSHLVIVIDEFRMLVEEAPEALSELMRIASIGRSLGIHLIMATQRPQGALTADIRANVTTSISLRVQSEMESMDIINSNVAASISVDTPGRAFLGRAMEAPLEFQAASLTAGAGALASGPRGMSVLLASEFIDVARVSAESEAGGFPGAIGTEPTPAVAIAPLLASMSALWTSMNGAALRKPVAPSLPLALPEPEADACNSHSWSVRLGLMDLPSDQRTAPLIWDPAGHGHLGLVGAPESGMQEAMRLAVLGVASHLRESHLYVLDPDGSLEDLASHGRVGARAGLHELRRALRVLERLAHEQSLRLGRKAAQDTPLVLVIAGWGSWVSAFRASPWGWAEDLVQNLVRDGGRAGITVVISGQRELVTSRFFAALPNRVYFPTGSSEDSRIAWPKLPRTPPAIGRAVAVGALVRAASLSAGGSAVCQFFAPRRPGPPGALDPRTQEPPLLSVPFRIESLPERVPAAEIPEVLSPPGSGLGDRLLRIGVGGDELEPISLRVEASGVLAVLGSPQSGKSAFIRLLPNLNRDSGPWLRPEAEPTVYWSNILRQAVAGEIDLRSVALVDDADLLPREVNRDVAELHGLGITVVFTAGFSPVLSQRVPLAIHARNSGSGVLIAPRTLLDGDLFGIRFEAEPNPPPGRSIVIQNGRATAAQLGWQSPDETG